MTSLPIDVGLPQIIEALRAHDSLVFVAPPGAGKTTRVPPAVIAAGILPKNTPNLIMLQPRRVAARAAAQRIAEEQNWRLGEQVGYHIRFEKRYGTHTRIRILTEAILTRMLLADQSLEGVGCVILDEFHERNIHSDLALAFLRDIQQTIRPDLKILVMSATLDAQPVAAFLGNCPVIETQGRQFPIDIVYRPSPPSRDTRLEDHIAGVISELFDPHSTRFSIQHSEFSILVFLPGIGEIERTRRALTQSSALSTQSSTILPLHGSLSSEEQQLALRPDAQGRRKIILATNIAETSLTIDGVRTVIDSGLARIASFDPDRGMDRLDLERISKASATQRAGRAGRQGPGMAIRLWPESEQKHLADFNVPEIHRVDLASTVLAVHAWGAKDPRQFSWFDPPPEEMLAAAEELLTLLGALKDGQFTDLGRAMLQIPAHPRIARLLLAALHTPHLADALTLAALLADESRSRSSPPSSTARADRPSPPTKPSDPLTQLDRIPPHLTKARDQLAAIARTLTPIKNQKMKIESTTDLLLLAYPDRVARRRGMRGGDPHAAQLSDGTGARLSPPALTPALAAAPLFLALDAHHDPRNKRAEALVHTAVPLDASTLERLLPDFLRADTALEYDPAKEKVIAFTRHYYRDLLLSEDPHGKVDAARAGPILATALTPRATELFTHDEPAAKLLARVALLRHHMPEHSWPLLDDAQLRELLAYASGGKRSLAELLDSHALADALRSTLSYPLDRLLDQHAPETITVPSGSRIKLEYTMPSVPGSAPPSPILAVRLQELFGLLDTPRIGGGANGRVPVLLHLLSPGYKPIQITSDLRSFWSSAYFEVRKDLRVRYPKHKWPEDPVTAQPEAKGRPRK